MSRAERLTVLRTAAEHFRSEAERWAEREEPEIAERFSERARDYERTARAVERSGAFS